MYPKTQAEELRNYLNRRTDGKLTRVVSTMGKANCERICHSSTYTLGID